MYIYMYIVCPTPDTEEQRDSAVSCSGVDSSHHYSEESLGIFALPSPDVPTHLLDACKYPIVQAKVRIQQSLFNMHEVHTYIVHVHVHACCMHLT